MHTTWSVIHLALTTNLSKIQNKNSRITVLFLFHGNKLWLPTQDLIINGWRCVVALPCLALPALIDGLHGQLGNK